MKIVRLQRPLFVLVPFLFVALSLPLHAQTVTETVLATGVGAGSALVQGSDGNFYGTTSAGGIHGDGTVFKMTPQGGTSVIYSFCNLAKCADGSTPGSYVIGPGQPGNEMALIQGIDGNFYGTTASGGSSTECSTSTGCGTVFKVTPSGVLTTIYNFCALDNCTDGTNPVGGLILGSDGNFYGTTSSGGTGFNASQNIPGGTVFKLTPGGTLTTLYNFCSLESCADGEYPFLALLQASDGNFYGTTYGGGPAESGEVFKVAGTSTTVYGFSGFKGTGDNSYSNLVEAGDGNLYGTTSSCNCSQGTYTDNGTVFQFTLSGGLNNLFFFPVSGADGISPEPGVFAASDGNLYGTTNTGGANSQGVAYEVTLGGDYTDLYNFCSLTSCTDGEAPTSSLLQGSDGNLYGFANGYPGNIYKLTFSPALTPPVQLNFASSTISLGSTATLDWQVVNAFSTTLQQCAAFVQGNNANAGTWTGLQPGTFDPTLGFYLGAANITPTASGTYTYALTCGGTETGFATLTVSKLSSTATVTATPDPVTVGQSVTLHASVTGAGATPIGTVTFYYGSTKLNTAVLSSGVGTFTVSTNGVPPGSYNITAVYSGDGNYNATTSPGYTLEINKAPTATTLVISPPTVTPPESVTLTATVTRSGSGTSGTPTGTVTYYYGTDALGTATLNSSGVAVFSESTKGVPADKYAVTAKYNGDSSDVTSTSAAESVTVQ